MGNDGGRQPLRIPTRRELVKEAARNPNNTEAKAKLLESQTHAWTYCPLSQRPLIAPIVSDSLGVLYNKDAIIEHLLPSDSSSPERKAEHDEVLQGRVKSIRDVVEIKFKEVKDRVTKLDKKICPITSKELGPTTKSVYLVPCGHAYAELAVKEVPSETCMECNEPFLPRDVVTILPVVDEDIQRMKDRMVKLNELGLTHSLKKVPGSKKSKKRKEQAQEGNGEEKAEKKQNSAYVLSTGTATAASGIKNASTASLTAKVLKEQEEKNKRRKLGMNDNLNSLFSKGNDGSKPNGGDFMTRGYSLPKKA